MNEEHLSKDKLELARSLLAEADAVLSPAIGVEMTALRHMLEHARWRLGQMPEKDFALRLAPIGRNPQN